MKPSLALVMITKNADELLDKALASVKGLVDEIIIVDDYSIDKTAEVARRHGAKVYLHHEKDFGRQKKYAVTKAKSDWILILDSDEIVSDSLKKEIRDSSTIARNDRYNGYNIPFQTHFLGHPLKYGGEDYKKLVLFKKNSVIIKPALLHEKFEMKNGKTGILKNPIYHYSYRSIRQMYSKFTGYAIRYARQKRSEGEKTTLRKIFLNPPHMFWSRYVDDEGYRDGIFRLPLDVAFAYMEFLTYFLMLFL